MIYYSDRLLRINSIFSSKFGRLKSYCFLLVKILVSCDELNIFLLKFSDFSIESFIISFTFIAFLQTSK